MKAKNKFLTLLILTAGAAATTGAINKFIKVTAISRNLLSEPQSLCYKWRLGNVHYTKSGSGKPLLLIHDLNASSSGYEWSQLVNKLQENYTVYVMDLLGCGRSEKINMTYTNYLYVQLICDFIQSEIGHRTSIVATGESASIAVMACANNSTLFDQIMMINPLSLLDFSQIPGKTAKVFKMIVDFPVIGTLLYHIANSKKSIAEDFTMKYFYNPYSVTASAVDSYYESAHLGNAPKSTYASIECNYTKCNITNALKKIDNSIYLIGGSGVENISKRLEEYKEFNSAIEISIIPNTKLLPQLENPSAVYNLIRTYFN